jgi:LysM repeat protein
MDWEGAIESFERALQANPNNASAHLELGVLYDQKNSDFAAAIYHYQRHLTLRTNSPMADVVKQNITACTRELAKTVQYAVVTREVQRDLERYAQTNSLLRKRIEFLEAELSRRPQYITNNVTNFVTLPPADPRGSRLTQPTQPVAMVSSLDPPDSEPPRASRSRENGEENAARTSGPIARQVNAQPSRRESRPAPSREEPRARSQSRTVHTVRPGQTLASLAAHYGVSLGELKAANPSAARGVRAGQKIVIPK